MVERRILCRDLGGDGADVPSGGFVGVVVHQASNEVKVYEQRAWLEVLRIGMQTCSDTEREFDR